MRLNAILPMVSMIPSVLRGLRTEDTAKIKTIVRCVFPEVNQVDTATLARWLEVPGQAIRLIDVRSPEEFAISHLPEAINLQKVAHIASEISKRGRTKTVLYCSVGFRSAMIAKQLPAWMQPEVYSLDGSIFEWANEGRPLWRDRGDGDRVHPYGRRWAGLLKPGLVAT